MPYVLVGMVQDSLPFRRTDKGGNAKRGNDNPALWETVLGIGLVLSAVLLFVLNTTNVIEMTVFASTLLVQSIPFLAAVLMVSIERYAGRTSAVEPVTAVGMALEAPTNTR